MKKIELKGKLTLNKETIAKLNEKQQEKIKGGFVDGVMASGAHTVQQTKTTNVINNG